MDLQQWKQAAKEEFEAMASALRTGAPGMLYGALSAGLAATPVANQIQAWKDRSGAEVAAELETLAAGDPEWRTARGTCRRSGIWWRGVTTCYRLGSA